MPLKGRGLCSTDWGRCRQLGRLDEYRMMSVRYTPAELLYEFEHLAGEGLTMEQFAIRLGYRPRSQYWVRERLRAARDAQT